MNETALTVRCAKLPSKSFHFLFKTSADDGSTFERRTTNLEWVEQIDRPTRIDISSNRLTEVDLSPLSSCKDLEYLSLATNNLNSIDLSPLEACKRLRNIDLSHNYLTSIDLAPLAGCKDLTYLYMQENMFQKVNVAPLLHLKRLTTAVIQLTSRSSRPKVVIDSPMSNKPPSLNDVLNAYLIERKAGFIPEWLYNKDSEVEYEPRSYRQLVDEFGWVGVRKHLMALSKSLRVGIDFRAQKVLLTSLGISELACYDGTLHDIVKMLPVQGSYEEGLHSFQSQMISLLEDQLERGGSTLYFDMDELATTPASVLIPSILSQREKEMKDLTLFDNKGKVDLLPLWTTSYGYNILKALGLGRKVSALELSEIQKALTTINHEFSVEKVVYDARKEVKHKYPTGNVILTHVRSIIS